MKLTKMSDGRFLLEIAGRAIALSAFEVAQLADLLEVKPVEWGPVRELGRELDEAHVEVDNYAAGAESLRKTIAGLRSELESTKDKASDFRLMAADRELELVKLREHVQRRQPVAEAARSWVKYWDEVLGPQTSRDLPATVAGRELYRAVTALNKTEGKTA
jgi:hypothetical protein